MLNIAANFTTGNHFGGDMKAIIWLFVGLSALSAQAVSITQLTCQTITRDAVVKIQFDKAVDPMQPWIGWGSFGASLEVKVLNSRQSYKRTDLRISPIASAEDVNMRGDASGFDGGALYLRLNPQISNGQATGAYTGQLFINDLNARMYFNFSSDGKTPGLICKPSVKLE